MPDSVDSPQIHRLLASPAGAALERPWFEPLLQRSFVNRFAIGHARAAADVSLGSGPAAFLDAVDAPPAPHLHARIERALAEYARLRDAYDEATARWGEAFWGDAETTPDERVDLERERRRAAARRNAPVWLFRFLASDHLLPPAAFDLPDPDATIRRWIPHAERPDRFYSAHAEIRPVERSREVRGPGTVEYLVRFPSPSPYVGGRASARVYEPADGDRSALPTLVYAHGLGMASDQQAYWPEEEYVARALAPGGYRVVLPEAPWHGRRETAGSYSGEPFLARAPVATFELFEAWALETGVLTDWARSTGAPAVGVGGISLGGITALHVAGHCGTWPASMRPDLVFPAAMTGAVDELLVEGDLSARMGLADALSAAGWTAARLRRLAPLLNPPAEPDVDPDRIVAFRGLADGVAPAASARDLLDSWDVPEGNRHEWSVGHFGVLVRLARDATFRNVVRDRLDAAASSSTEIVSDAA
ncbi:alpha/beta hydrolase [Halegenticoccus tardaugens]|uniref:alpha/beta hydrolase n=1 Tax=Halegenticoccus tardaugens TaxID=2071624 RepID=UPI00100BE216|nr:alpha/beta hydrolase [Halegenticoccus tardaugens]